MKLLTFVKSNLPEQIFNLSQIAVEFSCTVLY